jgi:hypothetical protein
MHFVMQVSFYLDISMPCKVIVQVFTSNHACINDLPTFTQQDTHMYKKDGMIWSLSGGRLKSKQQAASSKQQAEHDNTHMGACNRKC